MFLEVEHNPNFDGSYFLRFKEVGPARRVTHVKIYDRVSQGEWCEVTAWCDDSKTPLRPAYAQPVEDSGAGKSFLVFGGNWGIRLKPETTPGMWDLYNPQQWGEGYLLVADPRDLRFGQTFSLRSEGEGWFSSEEDGPQGVLETRAKKDSK